MHYFHSVHLEHANYKGIQNKNKIDSLVCSMDDCCPTGGNSIMKTYLNVTPEMMETNTTS